MVDVTVDADTFRALIGRSSQLEPKLRTGLRKALRETAAPAVADVKAAALQDGQTRSSQPRRTGLRSRIAARVATRISASKKTAGVLIISRGPLAAAWESERGWRHPLFGDRAHFYTQKGNPYFRRPITAHRDDGRQRIEAVMNDALKTLGASS